MSSNIDLAQLIFDKIEAEGPDKAAAFFGRTAATVRKWGAGTAQPDVGAAQKILDEIIASGSASLDLPGFDTPPEQGATRPDDAETAPEPVKKTAVSDGNVDTQLAPVELTQRATAAKKFSILTPVNRDMSFAVVLSMLGNWKTTLPVEIRPLLSVLDFQHDTLVHRGRNLLATRFLASGNEWSFWMDSDIIAPIGNPSWFRKRTNTKHADKWFTYSALERLTSRGKTLIGGVYSERSTGGKIIAQPGLSPKDETEKRAMEQLKSDGPEDRLLQVGWLGFGCVAVHRKVFEDILATQPDVKSTRDGEPHNFFNQIEGGPQGEDVAFCRRAAQAGHPSFLDLSVWCGHVGKFAFMP